MKDLYTKEDWIAVWIGFLLLGLSSILPMFPKMETWSIDTIMFYSFESFSNSIVIFSIMVFLFALAVFFQKENVKNFIFSFLLLVTLALVAQFLSAFELSRSYGFGYAFWALFIGLFISNVIGIKKTILKSLKSELIIKTGLVLLGAEILFSKMFILGLPALTVAWVVTPIVIIFMYYFGVKYLKLDDKLTIVIATATSVCGVSAAIACSSACKAKKEILTLAVSMTLIFTVIMMIAMPAIVQFLDLDLMVGGAWIGGTLDSTGAVVAAGAVLGQDAMDVAAIVKMIQNIMVGAVAFIVAIIWARDGNDGKKVSLSEIWVRFPKFILGFITASIVFSFIIYPVYGEIVVNDILEVSKSYRGLLFTLAFLAIGLESNFKELANNVQDGKPIYLYIVGQSFNIVLTLFVAYLAFGGVLFDIIK